MRLRFKAILLLSSIVFILLNSVVAQDKLHIAILKSDDFISTKRSISGAKSVIKQQHPDIIFHEFLIDQKKQTHQSIIDSLKNHNPTLIFTIGTSATILAKENFKKTPIVFSSVKYPTLSKIVKSLINPGENITGASLNIPVDVELRTFIDIVPNLKKVGVLYTNYTAPLIKPAKRVAKTLGIELVEIQIKTSKDIPNALDSLAKVVDGIWSVADPILFNPQSTRYILLNTLRKNIPFMGFSRHVVESGALFALDLDHKAVGRQAGAIVNRIVDGVSPKNIDVSVVDLIWFHYNEKTANHIEVTIPEEHIAVAKEVYR